MEGGASGTIHTPCVADVAAFVCYNCLLMVLRFTLVAALKELLELLQNTRPVGEVLNAKPLFAGFQ